MKSVSAWWVGSLFGILLVGGTGFCADLSPREAQGIQKGIEEPSKPDGSKNIEQLLMEGTEIQGAVEKPHVVYVIPWKGFPAAVEPGVSLRRSFKDEILEPVDRENFQHQWGNFPRGTK